MIKIGIFIISLVISSSVNAGLNGFTIHSRANCGNNESISWDWTQEWQLITISDHYYKGKKDHTVTDPQRWTKRSAAVHWGESFDLVTKPYHVAGSHFRQYTDNTFHLEGYENIYDCDIYNGWWDV